MSDRYAIIGFPISQSLSPLLHSTAFRAVGLDATYEPIAVEPKELDRFVASTLRTSFDGWNVTLPHKQRMAELVDVLDESARAVGAVNTVVRRDGRLTGYNTDVDGVIQTLQPHVQGRNNLHTVLIGAGGGARAVVAGLHRIGGCASLNILVRTPTKGASLLSSTGGLVPARTNILSIASPEAFEALSNADVIVQSTPLGMHPKVDDSPVPGFDAFRPGQIVFDLIYRPRTTRFLSTAKAAGATVLDGLTMFLYQGASAFQLWTGRAMPLDAVRPVIERELSITQV